MSARENEDPQIGRFLSRIFSFLPFFFPPTERARHDLAEDRKPKRSALAIPLLAVSRSCGGDLLCPSLFSGSASAALPLHGAPP